MDPGGSKELPFVMLVICIGSRSCKKVVKQYTHLISTQ